MSDDLQRGLDVEDPIAVAKAASAEDLARLIAAEELLEKRHARKRRSARVFLLAQALVGYVALAGFFANAYQNWNNKKQAEDRARTDEERWEKEFKRAQDADKYRAFFETSALATDTANPDKRLVGYALLKEFVADKDYNSKATFMLEEALALELRDDKGPGLDEPHRAAMVAIVSALSHTTDCRALEHAARTVDKLAGKRGQLDLEEARDIVAIYLLRLVGRAAVACSPKDLLDVRKPFRDLIKRRPEMAGLTAKTNPHDVDRKIAEIIKTSCQEELDAGVGECTDVPEAWKKLCDGVAKQKLADATGLCDG
jgi:hypothetical protein